MNIRQTITTRFLVSDFLDGLGSVFEITGSSLDFPLDEPAFQPTAIFSKIHEEPPPVARGFQADQNSLMNDWQKVGSDLNEAMNEFRESIGA